MAGSILTRGHSELAIARTMTVGREEYLDHMTFRANRRPLLCELFGPMVGLKDEWRDQGATDAELDMSAFAYLEPGFAGVPVSTGLRNPCPEELIEETDEYIIARDRYGRRAKLFKRMATIALPLEYPVADMDDWRSFEHHYEFDEGRLAGEWEAAAISAREAGRVVTVGIPGGFDEPRQLLGEERMCLAFYDQPELIHGILSRIGDTAFRVLERVSATVPVDQLVVHEDMAGKSGSLAGPKQIEEFIAPYYRRIWDMLADRGAQLFDQDSDGDMNGVIDAFLDAGVNVMHPAEPAAGMDIVTLRERHGTRLAFRGGLNKHVLRRGHAAIEAELESKIPPMVASGGCVLSLDHRIPNGSPLEAYRFYHAKAWEIMKRESERREL